LCAVAVGFAATTVRVGTMRWKITIDAADLTLVIALIVSGVAISLALI